METCIACIFCVLVFVVAVIVVSCGGYICVYPCVYVLVCIEMHMCETLLV